MVGSWFTSRWFAPAVLLILSLAAHGSLAADGKGVAITVFTKAPASATAGLVTALQAKARERGRLRVVAGLRIVLRPEHTLAAEEIEQQRRALKDIGTAVLARVLGDGPRTAAEPYAFQAAPYVALFVDAAQLGRLLADPMVASVECHDPLPPVDDQSGPPSPLVAAGTQDSVAAVQAPDVWARGYGGEYAVAVLDAGVQSGRGRDKLGNRVPAHPMLAGKVIAEACFSNAGRGGESLCPKTDSMTDAGAFGPRGEDGAAAPCDASLPSCWHGAHVSSLAAGNSGSRFGVARGANVVAVQIFTRFGAGPACGDRRAPCIAAYPEDIAKALERVLALRKTFPRLAAVVVGVAGGRYAGACDADLPLLAALTAELRRTGVAMVAPAGNRSLDGSLAAPACLSKAVAVGDATQDGKGSAAPGRGSNHAALVALTAPGASVVAAYPPALYAEATGTGVAAAHVAGGFALLRQVKPAAGVDELLTAMACTNNAVERNGVVKPSLALFDAYRYLIRAKGGARAWTFARLADAEDWTPISGAWTIQTGGYVGTPAPGDSSLMAALANCHASWDLSVTMLRADPDRTGYPAGLVVQASMDSDKWLKGYFLTFSPSGDANIWRLDGRTRTFLCPERGKFSVAANDYNTLRVVRNGSLLTYTLNGGLVCSVRDDTYASGAVVVSAPLPEQKQGGSVAVKSVELKPLGGQADASDAVIDPEKPVRASLAGAGAADSKPLSKLPAKLSPEPR